MPRKKTFTTLLVAALLMITGFMVFWLAISPPAGDSTRYQAASDPAPFGLYAPGTFEAMPADAWRAVIRALGLTTMADYQDYTLGLVRQLDASWARLDIFYLDKAFFVPEDYLAKLLANDIEVVGCLRTTDALEAADLTAYRNKVRQLVAAHPAIRTWQIDNEPNFFIPDPRDYAELFSAGQAAVKEACPGCRVALAGVPTLDPSREESLAYFDTLLEELASRSSGEGAPFEIFDIHFYGTAGAYEGFVAIIDDYKGLLKEHSLDRGVRIWMTECGTYSGRPAFPAGLPAQSERQQASELVKRFVAALGAGLERMAWARFYENYQYGSIPGNYYDFSGLVYNGLGAEAASGTSPGTRKEAFFAYQDLITRLVGYKGVSRLAPGQYRFDFTDDDRKPLYVVWSVPGVELAESLTGRVFVTTLSGESFESNRLEPGDEPVFVNKG